MWRSSLVCLFNLLFIDFVSYSVLRKGDRKTVRARGDERSQGHGLRSWTHGDRDSVHKTCTG